MIPLAEEPPAIETHIYRDRAGYLRVRARWTNPDGTQHEVDEGGVDVDAYLFVTRTLEPLVRRTMVGRSFAKSIV